MNTRKTFLMLCAFASLTTKAQISTTSFNSFSFLSSSATNPQPHGVATADFDGDAKHDVVVTNGGAGTIAIFRNTSSSGSVSFASKIELSTGSGPEVVKTNDIDGDGKQDIVVWHWGDSYVSIFRNTTASGVISFATRVDIATPTGKNSVSGGLGDFDGDGKTDIQASNYTGGNISVFRNTSSSGTISFATRQDFAFTGSPSESAVADFDGDGRVDLAVSKYVNPGAVVVYRNISTMGSIDFNSPLYFTAGVLNHGLNVGDIDGDGKTDMATSNYNSGTISVFRNTSSGSGNIAFSNQVVFNSTGASGPSYVLIQDLDNDNKKELCVANFNGSDVSVFKNQSSSGSINSTTFPQRVEFSTGSKPAALASADIDGDGRRDLLSADYGTNTFTVLRNEMSFTGQQERSQEEAFEVFPNPFKEKIRIISDKAILSVELIDMGGKTVKLSEGTSELALGGLKSGVYFLKVISDNEISFKKLVKE